ncbi:hypothetical protein ACH5RR_015243 [Cinchona calisaya]|uniref:Uncharacterized protein n=1 Tax=Cinchona calisaya TaxID=153742 RepID=A0ABD2ZTD7_9GENT
MIEQLCPICKYEEGDLMLLNFLVALQLWAISFLLSKFFSCKHNTTTSGFRNFFLVHSRDDVKLYYGELAEAMAARDDALFTQSIMLSDYTLERDSMSIVNMLKSDEDDCSTLAPIV